MLSFEEVYKELTEFDTDKKQLEEWILKYECKKIREFFDLPAAPFDERKNVMIDEKDLSPAALEIFCLIWIMEMNEDRCFWTSLNRIHANCNKIGLNYSRATYYKVFKELEAKGFLKCLYSFSKGSFYLVTF